MQKNKIKNKNLLYLLCMLTVTTFGFLPAIYTNVLINNDDTLFLEDEETVLDEEEITLDEDKLGLGGGTGNWTPPEQQGIGTQWLINANTTIYDEEFTLETTVNITGNANVTIDNCIFRFDNSEHDLVHMFNIETTGSVIINNSRFETYEHKSRFVFRSISNTTIINTNFTDLGMKNASFGQEMAYAGLTLLGNYSTVENCTFTDCEWGILMMDVIGAGVGAIYNVTIHNNTFINCVRSLVISGINHTVTNNTMINNKAGFWIVGNFSVSQGGPTISDSIEFYDHTIVGNTFDGDPLVYIFNQSNLVLEFMHITQPYGIAGQIIYGWCENITIRHSEFSNDNGISFSGSANCTVENSTFTNCGDSIGGVMGGFYTFKNNTISNSYVGVLLSLTDFGINMMDPWNASQIVNNTISNIDSDGILSYGMYTHIRNNTINNAARYGIFAGVFTNVTSNNITGGKTGIYLEQPMNSWILWNNITKYSEYGFFINGGRQSEWQLNIAGNLDDGYPLVYLLSVDDTVIDETIFPANSIRELFIAYTKNCTIANLTMSDGSGIILGNTYELEGRDMNITITNYTSKNNAYSGIHAHFMRNLTIHNCSITGSDVGITSTGYSADIFIDNCSLSSNDYGITTYLPPYQQLQSGVFYSWEIFDNVIENNDKGGMLLMGPLLWNIYNNTLNNNGNEEIYIMNALMGYINIRNNTITGSYIILYYSYDIDITDNDFTDVQVYTRMGGSHEILRNTFNGGDVIVLDGIPCETAIVINESMMIDIKNNTIFDVASFGIITQESYPIYIDNNTIYNIGSLAIWLNHSIYSSVTENTIYNVMFGVEAVYCNQSNIVDNEIYDIKPSTFPSVPSAAVFLLTSNNSMVQTNLIHNATEAGILVWMGIGHNIYTNTVYNSTWGIVFNQTKSSNNIIFNNFTSDVDIGIWLVDTEGLQIQNNEIFECDIAGIYLDPSPNNVIMFNTINCTYSAAYGIYVEKSNNSMIFSNWIYNATQAGIYVNESSLCNISSNTVYNSSYQIYLKNSDNNTIQNNMFQNNYLIDQIQANIGLEGSSYNNISNHNFQYSNATYGIAVTAGSMENDIFNNYFTTMALGPTTIYGIYVSGSNGNLIHNNTLVQSGWIAVYLTNANGNDIWNNTVYLFAGSLMYFSSGSDYNLIHNNTLQYSMAHLFLGWDPQAIVNVSDSDFNQIYDNTIWADNGSGIELADSHNNTIKNNDIYNATNGIYLDPSHDNIITGNDIYCFHSGQYGVYLENSDRNLINDTHIQGLGGNFSFGIYLYFSDFNNLTYNYVDNNLVGGSTTGIYIEQSDDNRIFNNTKVSSAYTGIELRASSERNYVFNNTVSSGWIGIELSSSITNYIYQNTINWPSMHGIGLYTGSNNNDIYLNDIWGSSTTTNGIYLSLSSGNDVFNNTFDRCNEYGLYLRRSDNNNFYNNTLSNIGDGLNDNIAVYLHPEGGGDDNHHNEFVQNIITGVSNLDYIFVIDGGDFNKISFHDFVYSGEDLIIIYLLNGANNTEIFNNTMESSANPGTIGVNISSSHSNEIYNNTIRAFDVGIRIDPSSGNIIQENIIGAGSVTGILIFNSDSNKILDNDIWSWQVGVNLTNSDLNNFTGNSIFGNFKADVLGYLSHDNVFDNNDFLTSDLQPVMFSYSNGNNFTNNYFNHSGLNLDYCYDTLIYNNNMENATGTMGPAISITLNNTLNTIILDNDLYEAHMFIFGTNVSGTIIENNTFYDQPVPQFEAFPVFLNISSWVEIRNNTIRDCLTGILLWETNNSVVTENWAYNLYNKSAPGQQTYYTFGVAAVYALDTNLTLNRVFNVTGVGIAVAYNCSRCDINYNTIYNSTYGIEVFENCSDIDVVGNVADDDLIVSIYIDKCSDVLVQGNDLSDSNSIEGAGIFVVNCTYVEVYDNLLEHIGLTFDEFDIPPQYSGLPVSGILFWNVNNSEIVNNTIQDCKMGIIANMVLTLLVENNTLIDTGQNGWYTLYVASWGSCILRNNTIDGGSQGIAFGGGSNHLITENTVKNIVGDHTAEDQGSGIYIMGVSDTEISSNTVYNIYGNSTAGMQLMGGAIVVRGSYNILITQNNASFTNQSGIYVQSCENINATWNYVHNITGGLYGSQNLYGHGILYSSVNNSFIFRNWVYNNNMSGIYAISVINVSIQWNEIYEIGEFVDPYTTMGGGRAIAVANWNLNYKFANIDIDDNLMYECKLGIILMRDNGTSIVNNTMTHCGVGMALMEGYDYYIHNNSVLWSVYALWLDGTNETLIDDNIFDLNTAVDADYAPDGYQAVIINGCQNVTFTLNTISNNTDGILVNISESITIYNNEMFNNTAGTMFDIGINVSSSRWINISWNNIWAGAGNDYNYGILFSMTNNSYIEFNSIADVDSGSPHAGIYLDPSENNKIYNNTITGGYYGISIDGSQYNDIYNNTLVDSDYFGIYLINADWNNIYQNKIIRAGTVAISLESSENIDIYYNDIERDTGTTLIGIILTSNSDWNEIYNNTIDDVQNYGIRIMSSTTGVYVFNNTIDGPSTGIEDVSGVLNNYTQNIIYGASSAIRLANSDRCKIYDNLIGSTNDIGINIEGATTVNCDIYYNTISMVGTHIAIRINLGAASVNDIYNNTITGSNTAHGIRVINSRSLNITYNDISSCGTGIWISGSATLNDVHLNDITSCTTGIIIASSSNQDVYDNDITSCTVGIWIDTCGSKNEVHDNTLTSCTTGVLIEASSNQDVRDNTLTSCNTGIHLISASSTNIIYSNDLYTVVDVGIITEGSNTNNISWNYIEGNSMVSGVNVTDSTDEDVYYNDILYAEYGMYISGTCTDTEVSFNDIYNNTIGVSINNSDAVVYIHDNDLFNNTDGININDSISALVRWNNITYNLNDGIGLYDASWNSIYLNKIANNSNNGIYLDPSQWNQIYNNTIDNNVQYAIYVRDSGFNQIFNNTFIRSYYGIYLIYSDNNTITQNDFTSPRFPTLAQMFLTVSDNNTVSYNTVVGANGIYVGGVNNIENTIIYNILDGNSAGTMGITCIYSRNSNISHNTVWDYITRGISLGTSGIYIEYSNISFNEVYNTQYGIRMEDGLLNTIKNNTIHDNSDYGIYITSSSGTLIYNNSIYDHTDIGIELVNSESTMITQNNFTNNDYTIRLLSGSDNAVISYNSFVQSIYSIYSYGDLGEIFNNTFSQFSQIAIGDEGIGNNVYNNTITGDDTQDGIFIDSSNGEFMDNIITTCVSGFNIGSSAVNNDIYLNKISDCLMNAIFGDSLSVNDIFNNTIDGMTTMYNGVNITSSTGAVRIFNNTIHECFKYGIFVEDSDNTEILNNTLYDNPVDIFVNDSSTVKIEGNSITGSLVQLYSSLSASIRFNIFIDVTIFLKKTNSSYIFNNILTGSDSFYSVSAILLLNETQNNEVKGNVFIGSDADFAIFGFNTYGTIVENNTAHHLMGTDKIVIRFVFSDNVEIRDNDIYLATICISIQLGINNLVEENNLYDILSSGIFVYGETGAIIDNNTIYNATSSGIIVYSSSNNVEVKYNQIFNSTVGIYSWNTSGYVNIHHNDLTSDLVYGIRLNLTQDNLISTNNISDCSIVGIYLENSTLCNFTYNNILYSENGTVLINSSFNILSGEDIFNMTYTGLYLLGSWNNTLKYSNVVNCSIGLHILNKSGGQASHNNSIYWNLFNNTQWVPGGVNGYDWGWDNNYSSFWPGKYDVGNYWDDYMGVDTGGSLDIGDTLLPYNLTESNAEDWFPLTIPDFAASQDTDGDTISDATELAGTANPYGDPTNPNLKDSDGDGIDDNIEIDGSSNPWGGGPYGNGITNPAEADTDNDLVNDGDEISGIQNPVDGKSTNPLDDDTDNDGIIDGREFNGFFNQYFQGPYNFATNATAADSDGDGLTDGQELIPALYVNPAYFNNDTDPWNNDTDYDGLYDNSELYGLENSFETPNNATNPQDRDTDDDGIWDSHEVWGTNNTAYNNEPTDPNHADTDGDNLDDYEEIFGTGNLYDGLPTNATDTDTDNDGLNDYIECTGIGNYNGQTTNATNPDTDGEGLNDGDEVSGAQNQYDGAPTDPNLPDTDGDGLNDTAECTGSGNLYDGLPTNASAIDTDGDGLNDTAECTGSGNQYLGAYQPTNASAVDTDGDNLNDYIECTGIGNYNNQPTNATDPDTDDDGLTDNEEVTGSQNAYDGAPTDPLLVDTDSDGLNDTAECTGSGNLFDNAPTNPLDTDTDNDTLDDLEECIIGVDLMITDPNYNDTDLDTMWDGFEFDFRTVLNATDPIDNLTDTDNDLLTAVYEFNLRLVYGNWTNPTKNDSDFDGMADKWEDDNAGLDPTDASDASDDEDTDGLNNLGEFNNNCDPNDSDSEDDGMWDGFEVIFGLNPLIDDSLGDPDDDDLNNLQEFTLRLTYGSWTSPISADSDGDTMTDGWEVYYHSQDPLYLTRPWQSFNPLNASDALLDTKYDNDGLINADEYAHGSNPWDTDSDDDGLSDYDEVETYETDPADTDTDGDQCPDGWEVTYGLDPTKSADGALDIDVDGLANYLEYRFGTKPNVADTDEDDLLDGEEVIKGEDGYITNATNPDTDGDGFTDGEEFLAGTDPTDPNSFPAGLDPVMLIIIFGSIGGGVAAVLGIYFVRKRGGAKVKKGKKKKDIYVPEEYVYKGGEGKK